MATNTKYALDGRIVTMDAGFKILEKGTIFVDSGSIIAVSPIGATPPPDFAGVKSIKTNGTIYPGLIELHNHMSYNALPLWNVPKKYTNRDQWSGPQTPAYHQLITAPMRVLSRHPDLDYLRSVVRFAECRCLLGGVTTSQGIALASNAGIVRYYHGVIRTLESPGDLKVPAASTHIADVASKDADKFLAQLDKGHCLLLHLSEGTNTKAHEHFEALHLQRGKWAITKNLGCIHCVALNQTDFDAMQANGGAMIWSPLSNLLLYGETADIRAAKSSGVRMGMGSDWAPSGSKNLLGELKVARLVSQNLGGVFSDQELVTMATSSAAEIAEWDHAVGSLEPGKRADLLIINGVQGEPYSRLIEARETDIKLVVVDGVARYGHTTLMKNFGLGTEPWKVGGRKRTLNLGKDTPDPTIGNLTLRAAYDKVSFGLTHLPQLADNLDHPAPQFIRDMLSGSGDQWSLVLDHDEPEGIATRPHLPYGPKRELTAMMPKSSMAMNAAAAAIPLSEQVTAQTLDPLTVADDETFLDRLTNIVNLPDYLKTGLPKLY